MKTVKEIEAEIVEKQKELKIAKAIESLDKQSEAIKGLVEYTDKEKIEMFNRLYRTAREMFDNRKEDTSDDEHYTWEDVMNLLARDKDKFWKLYNTPRN